MLLCSSLFIEYSHVAGDITGGGRRIIVNVSSLLPNTVCLSNNEAPSTGPRLKLTHKHGPCSPLKHTTEPNQTQILTQDQSRVNFIHRTTTKNTTSPITASKIPAHIGDSFSTSNYIVTIGIGTPKNDFTVAFDTGSDVTWIQCQPCDATSCYSQQEPLFNPSQSSTYSAVPCSAPACTQLYSHDCSTDNQCVYSVRYGDKSSTTGVFSEDTLTLSSSDILSGFFFGCGNNNQGIFGKVAGLLGLGRAPASLISQSNTKYNGVFSYCLPSTSSSTGYLNFGGPAPANLKYTSMLSVSSQPSFYFLSLQSISVAGTKLSISPTVFSAAGTIIDSGTVISRLPPAAYSSLREAFRQKMAKYPTAPTDNLLDTCYDLSSYGNNVEIPTVELEFAGGVVVELDTSGILFMLSSSQACLGFAGNDDAGDLAILGNTQQRKLSVVYDVPNQAIGFGQGGCD